LFLQIRINKGSVGYTLAYGEGNAIIGDFKYAFHVGVLSEPVGTIPAILFSEFQLIFQATVCAIAVGGACERGRILPLIPFIFVRSLFFIVSLQVCTTFQIFHTYCFHALSICGHLI
jgi:ammonia channel protein AmtB